jgi:hypothetical protein
MSVTPLAAASLPLTEEEWDTFVRAERRRQGLPAEISEDLAANVAAILLRGRNPAAARQLLRGNGDRTA